VPWRTVERKHEIFTFLARQQLHLQHQATSISSTDDWSNRLLHFRYWSATDRTYRTIKRIEEYGDRLTEMLPAFVINKLVLEEKVGRNKTWTTYYLLPAQHCSDRSYSTMSVRRGRKTEPSVVSAHAWETIRGTDSRCGHFLVARETTNNQQLFNFTSFTCGWENSIKVTSKLTAFWIEVLTKNYIHGCSANVIYRSTK
jgi:hypothetical protein